MWLTPEGIKQALNDGRLSITPPARDGTKRGKQKGDFSTDGVNLRLMKFSRRIKRPVIIDLRVHRIREIENTLYEDYDLTVPACWIWRLIAHPTWWFWFLRQPKLWRDAFTKKPGYLMFPGEQALGETQEINMPSLPMPEWEGRLPVAGEVSNTSTNARCFFVTELAHMIHNGSHHGIRAEIYAMGCDPFYVYPGMDILQLRVTCLPMVPEPDGSRFNGDGESHPGEGA
jgi:hypothetical protein